MKLTPDPTAVFSLDSSHPQRSSIFSGAVALEQCTFSGFEPQTRVFGYTPAAAKGKSTHGSLDAENVPSLAAVSITVILRVESLTCVGIFESGVLRGARRTLRTAHPITRSLSDAASNFASLPALRSNRSCLLSPSCPTSVYSDSSSASASSVARRFARSDSSSLCVAMLVLPGFFFSSIAPGCVASWMRFSLPMDTCV